MRHYPARLNPFRVERVHQYRYQMSPADKTQLLQRLDEIGGMGALVGPHGHGKTTLMEDLADLLEQQGQRCLILQLSAEKKSLSHTDRLQLSQFLSVPGYVCLDGAEQMGFWSWRQFKRDAKRASHLITTQHKHGRLPTLKECYTSPELLFEIVSVLTAPVNAEQRVQLGVLYLKHRTNIRDCLQDLYDQWSDGKFPEWPGSDLLELPTHPEY
jgi:energy-coupling factor transporter ATP-binding protein EcfA2